jgi:large repetitive protein
VSGSTIAPFYGTSRSKTISTVLEAEIAAAELLIDSIIATGGGDTVKFAIIPHASGAYIQDMDLTTPGIQIYTTATADRNGNGIADIREILHSYTPDGSNNFTTALTQIDSLFDVLTGDPNLIFLSDGYGRLDPLVAQTVVADIKAKGGNVSAFGIGEASTVETLQKIDPTAIRITNFQQLVKIFSGFDDNYAIEPLKQNVTVYLDINNNGILDPDEPNQITRPNPTVTGLGTTVYNYSFNNLLPGNYTVRTLAPNGYIVTSPTTITDTVTVTGGEFTHLTGIGKTTTPVNVDPLFLTTAPVGTKLPAGAVFTYRSHAVDNNADPLTYSLINAPTGMTVDATTGVVVWNPTLKQVENYYQELAAEQARLTAIGRGAYARTKVEFNTYLRVSDGVGGQALQLLKLELLPNNRTPIFTSTPTTTTPQIGKLFEYTPTAVDPDADSISYSLIGNFNPTGVTVDPTTGKVTWTPTAAQIGSQQIALQVTDTQGGSSIQKLDLNVINPIANRPPVISSSPRTQTGSGQLYVYQIAASDLDGDKLTYTLTNPPSGMVINANTGLITWTPNAAQAGVKNVDITVSDGTLTTHQTYALTVGNIAINHSPEITSTPSLITNLDKTYSYQLTGKDSDNDTLIWSLDNAPKGMVIDAQTGIVKWNPTSLQLGSHTIAVRLTDAYGLYVGQEYTLKVNGVNIPAQIQSTPNTSAGVNSLYQYQVKAVDIDGDSILNYSLGRYPQGMNVDANTGLITWTPNSSQTGSQIIDVLVTDAQGAVTTQTYNLVVGSTPISQPPTITSTPKLTADINRPYQYQIVANDPENQQLTYTLTNPPVGMIIDANTGLITWNNPTVGTTQITIAAIDASGAVAVQEYTLTGKQNHPSVINSTPITQMVIGNTYRYDVIAKDSDNDALIYSLDNTALALGITIDKLGRITWKPTTTNIGIQPVTVTVTDAIGAVVTQTYNLEVLADNIAPVINLVSGTNIANIGETISFVVQASDNVGIKSTQLLINNQAVTLDSNGVGTYTVTTAGIVTATAIVTDINGNTSTKNSTVNIIDPTDVEAPIINLDLSGIVNGIVTGRTDIKGTVTDTNLDYYIVEVARLGTGEWKEVFRGNNSITNGVLGKFDPSLLENDSYQIRLTAVDSNGHSSSVEDEIEVTGDLKLGNFRLSFTDLTIPVTGIPISLTRTYDSLTNGTTDDFGYGWRMEFRDTDLRTSLKKDETYEQLDYRTVGFNFGTRIYITLPGGRREGFTFQPQLVQGALGGLTGGRLYYPAFVSDKGVTSTLTVPNAEIKANVNTNSANGGEFSGNPNGVLLYKDGKLFNLAGRPYVPQDDGFGNRYILTTKDGTQYEINASTGDLETVKDTNGNTLTYSDTEIKSSTGVSVTFERDNQGRIISVTDPLGQKVVYGYDAKGDLVTVSDRDGNETKFEYNAVRGHYLDKIVDPLGREAVKTEYDELGRLKKTANSSGNGVEFVYNPANSLETVKDALGNATTFEYDVRGNVVTQIDAVGKVTKSTYDDDNNLLSQTVISDRSGAAGFTTTYTYDGQQNKLSETDALGNTTYYTYGEKGRLLFVIDALGRTNANAYDGNGDLISTKDSDGNLNTFSYDSKGQLLSMTDMNNYKVNYTYDIYGKFTSNTDVLGHTINNNYDLNDHLLSQSQQITTASGIRTITDSSTYDKQGRQLTKTNTLGNITTYNYNSLGQKIAIIDALGRISRMVYDNDGKLIETILPDSTPNDLTDNPRTKIQYDAMGRQITLTDTAGKVMQMVYDAVGRTIEIIFPDSTPDNSTDNPRIKTEYYSDGLVKANIDKLGHRTEYRYDANGRQISIIYADSTLNDLTDNPVIRTVYNSVGQVTQTIDSLGRVTKLIYDNLGRLVATKFADGTEAITEYDKLGRKTASVDQNGNKTKYIYDRLSRLIEIKDALQNSTTYNYDELSRLLSMTDAEGQTTSYEYDNLGRKVATILPLNQLSTISYDVISNISNTTDFNGKTTTYRYDAQNRLVEQDFTNDPTVAMTYTIDGQVATITDGRGLTSFSYDVQNRLVSKTDVDGSKISYTYDLAGNRTSVTTQVLAGNANTTYYTFDERNRLDKVLSGGVILTDYDYDAMSNLVKTTFSNGVIETRQYDKLDHLLNLQTSKGNNILTNFVYTLDKVGNRQQVVETVGSNTRTVSYTYDDLYRLTKEQVTDAANGNRTTEFVYDKVGNRQQQQVTANNVVTATTYQYDANDRLLKEQVNGNDKVIYTYDKNGNTLTKTEDGNTTESIWNDQNRLVGAKVKDGAGVVAQQVSYEYDASGIRVSQNVDGEITKYLIDANLPYAQAVVEYRPSGLVVVSYTHGNDLISQTRDGVGSFYHVDGLGSTRGLSDTSGNLIDTYSYQAFGDLLNSSGGSENKYLFAGEQFDPVLGDYYNRARYYDPETGRFTRRDDYSGQIEDPISLHKYLYANANPVNKTDPTGYFSLLDVLSGIAIAGFVISYYSLIPFSYGFTRNNISEEEGGNIENDMVLLANSLATSNPKGSAEDVSKLMKYAADRINPTDWIKYSAKRSDYLGILSDVLTGDDNNPFSFLTDSSSIRNIRPSWLKSHNDDPFGWKIYITPDIEDGRSHAGGVIGSLGSGAITGRRDHFIANANLGLPGMYVENYILHEDSQNDLVQNQLGREFGIGLVINESISQSQIQSWYRFRHIP